MTEQLWLIAGATEYQVHELTDGSRYVQAIRGFGMPPVSHITQRGVRQDGATLLDVRLNPRVLDVAIVHQAATRAGYWQARRGLLDMLKVFDNLTLRLVLTDTGEAFELDVVYAGGAELDSDEDIGLRTLIAGLRLVAHDPVWRRSEPSALTVGVPSYEGAGVFPVVFGALTFGTTTINRNIALTYAGTYRAYPTIDIRGPIRNPSVTNLTTGEVLTLDRGGTVDIDAGEVVRIDLSPLAKTVWHLADDVTWLDKLSDGSDLATWHLAAAPEAAGGENALLFQGFNAGVETAMTLRWSDRFIGV